MSNNLLSRWDSTRDGTFSEKVLIAKIESLGFKCTRYKYPPGTYFPEHCHEVDKIDAVISGNFRIVLDGREIILGAGDYIYVPRLMPHTAEVIGDAPVESIDAIKIYRACN